ncbi:MAG: N-6 DNA methylase [Cellulomonadaceae bacterium]|nr:N-6 DNA methylase [Cellulomonadaceae bacterium]
MAIESFDTLVTYAAALGAMEFPHVSAEERALVDIAARRGFSVNTSEAALVTEAIRRGEDPLGEAFCRLRSPAERRPHGQTYTPDVLVDAMVRWTLDQPAPTRIIDTGVGSGRYLLAAGQAHSDARIVGVDIDPIAALMARANLAVAGMTDRSTIHLTDYRSLRCDTVDGPTLFIGNPPYVRHHQISCEWKQWLADVAARYGHKASRLAGLHVHFFLATLAAAKPGDYGTFVTSSEWLDVNYGALVRDLLTDQLGGESIHVLAPDALPFADAATTAAITCFRRGSQEPSIRLQPVASVLDLGRLDGGVPVAKDVLRTATRWSPLLHGEKAMPEGFIELGQLARVHRGAVTGANKVWVRSPAGIDLPDRVLHRCVTRAKELFVADDVLDDSSHLKVVIDLPANLDELNDDERRAVRRFLRRPDVAAARDGYIASTRKAWWSVGLKAPAPILATYMARRPPAFVINEAEAKHINIAHGIYPRQDVTATALRNLAAYLRTAVTLRQGRTYAGGLTKFEPREMERIPVPELEVLSDDTWTPAMV